jgi:purine nucleosidase
MHISARCRVVIDNDWAGDPDGLVALAHHLLSPANEVVAITGSLTNPMFGPPAGQAEAGIALAGALAERLGAGGFEFGAGSDEGFNGAGRASAASQLIIDAASGTAELPLVVVCAGPLTNVADALALAPQIASRFTLAWVGGSTDGADEYNEFTDRRAADFVFGNPHLPITQFPLETYRQLALSMAELEYTLLTGGEAGAWLWNRFKTLPLPDFVKLGPSWCMGDSTPLVGTALDGITSRFAIVGDHPVRRICTDVDARMVFGDLSARLRLYAMQSR